MKLWEVGKLAVGSVAVSLAAATCSGVADQLTGAGGSGTSAGSTSKSSGVIPNANADESGSRLRANYVEGSDGSKHFLGTFYDTQRGEDCAFAETADGLYLCLPTVGIGATISTALLFEDAQCTQGGSKRVLYGQSCTEKSPSPLYTIERDSLACIAAVSTAKRLPACYVLNGTTCVQFTTSTCDVVDQPLSFSTFVSGTVKN